MAIDRNVASTPASGTYMVTPSQMKIVFLNVDARAGDRVQRGIRVKTSLTVA